MSATGMSFWKISDRKANGFTLVELAIVLVIVGLLVGGMAVVLSAALDSANRKETQRRLTQAQEALLGFAAGNGRLPCPAAAPNAGGAEAPAGTGLCTSALNGFLPATTLGLGPTDDQGYLLDAWGNRIRYAVYNSAIAAQTNVFTIAGNMKSIGLETLSTDPSPTPRKLLYICDADPGAGATSCGGAKTLTDNAVAVLFSTGKNGNDQTAGAAIDNFFVSAVTADFDDIVTWLSPNILYNRLIAAGRLP